jgi:hypothetical protein
LGFRKAETSSPTEQMQFLSFQTLQQGVSYLGLTAKCEAITEFMHVQCNTHVLGHSNIDSMAQACEEIKAARPIHIHRPSNVNSWFEKLKICYCENHSCVKLHKKKLFIYKRFRNIVKAN